MNTTLKFFALVFLSLTSCTKQENSSKDKEIVTSSIKDGTEKKRAKKLRALSLKINLKM